LFFFLLQKFIFKEGVYSPFFFKNFFSGLSVPDFLLEWTWSGRSATTEQTGRLPGDSPANLPAAWLRITAQWEAFEQSGQQLTGPV
jgi:hypothetical protein